MEKSFWLDRWQAREIGFHEGEANRLLVAHWRSLGLAVEQRVFVPLCGKTVDIHWLRAQGHRVAGAEFSATAIEELFQEMGLQPRIEDVGSQLRYSAPGIDIYCGDIFALDANTLGPIDAVYDRAALVALPRETRARYARHLRQISADAPQLLIAFDYDQNAMAGPPFAVPSAEVEHLFAASHRAECLAAEDIPGGLKGQCAATEQAWKLTPLR